MVMGPQQRFWRTTPRTKNRALRDRYSVWYLLRAGRLRASDILSRNRVPVQRIRRKKFFGPNGTLRDRYSIWEQDLRGVYARAPPFYETVYLCSGILTTTRDLPRLSLEVVGR